MSGAAIRLTATGDLGSTVLELPTRAEAVEWARRMAVACRCAPELGEFGYDPES